MTARSLLLSALSLAIGLGIALILAEVVVRLSGIASPLTYLPNPDFGWSHTPGDEFQRQTEERVVDVRINSLGLRDEEYPYRKPQAVKRVLVLGDSFAEAVQVPLADTFAKRVERLLNASGDDEFNDVEVLNAGISGFGTDNELLFFRHEGYKYQPDVVLLALYVGNDIRNNWYRLENIDSGGFRKPYFTPAADGLEINAYPFEKHRSIGSRIKVFLNRNVRLYSLLREMRDRFRVRAAGSAGNGEAVPIPLDANLFAADDLPEWQTALRVTEQLLRALANEAREAGAEVFVVLIPAQFQVHPEYWQRRLERIPAMRDMEWDLDKPNRLLNAFLAAEGIAHLDLLPAFRQRAAETGTELYLAQDGHWNEAGHKLAAERITTRLRQLLANGEADAAELEASASR